MARVHKIPQFLHFFIYSAVILYCFTSVVECANRDLDEDNWKDILEGEWMVEFYAPWCPACNALAPAWKELSSQATRKRLELKTGAVDVTKSPGLSGRFVVTALPTIFHVINGEFRQYKGPRDADSMMSFVEQGRWKQTEPVPSWKAPHSIQMTLVAEFFKLSQALRSVHNMLMETYGLPTWGSYLIFAVATIFIGAILGLMLVCIIDLLYPPRRSDKAFIPQAEVDRRAKGDHDNKQNSDNDQNQSLLSRLFRLEGQFPGICFLPQELLNEDIVDDDNEQNSDAEKNSPSDTSEDEAPVAAAGGDSKPEAEPEADGARPEVRKRRPRKAD